MPIPSLRKAPLLALATFILGAAASAAWSSTRDARADARSSSVQVPPEGLTFRAADGRAIARLSYDARGGVFEVLGEHGDPVATMGASARASGPPAPGPLTGWSIDAVRDPWSPQPSPAGLERPSSGL